MGTDNLIVKVHPRDTRTIYSENGIESIEKPNGTIIYGHGKNKVGIDYSYSMGDEKTFKIKESFLKDGINEFLKRLTPYCSVEIIELTPIEIKDENLTSKVLEDEGVNILSHINVRLVW